MKLLNDLAKIENADLVEASRESQRGYFKTAVGICNLERIRFYLEQNRFCTYDQIAFDLKLGLTTVGKHVRTIKREMFRTRKN